MDMRHEPPRPESLYHSFLSSLAEFRVQQKIEPLMLVYYFSVPYIAKIQCYFSIPPAAPPHPPPPRKGRRFRMRILDG